VAEVKVVPESVPHVLGLIVQATPSGSLVVAVTDTCAASPTELCPPEETARLGGAPTVKVTEADLLGSGFAAAVTVAVQPLVRVAGGV